MTSLRRVVPMLAAASLALAGALPLAAQAPAPTAQLPVLLTSCGQSPGPERVKFFLNRLQLQHEFLARATAQDLVAAQQGGKPYKALIIVTGASLKGMGAAGVSMPQELARTEALIAEAKRQGITVIGSHVEGMARRAQGAAAGDNSDEQSIDAVMPNAAFMIVRKDGDEDRRFTVISQKSNIPLLLFEKNMELGELLGRVFGK
ncbi:MAG TPA: DUF6305 family protein [Longimicrobiales bacterium]|nr:DUF6305 family protein [Longimicrobiales bacterium]